MQNAHLAKALFPGWACVFYVGDGVSDVTVEALQGAGAVVRRCTGMFGCRRLQMLRFLPAGEPGVSTVIVRDADSRLNPRDAAAVFEWLASDRKFHAMHEAPHDPETGILGGAWGARSLDAQPPLPDLYAQMRAFAASHSTDKYGDDMVFLETYLRPLCASLCHHSAAAKGGRLVADVVPRPFPTIVPGLRRPARELPRQVRLGVVREGGLPARRGRGRRRARGRRAHPAPARRRRGRRRVSWRFLGEALCVM